MKKSLTLPILTLGHFGVDLACLYFYFASFPQNGLIAGITAALLYNFLAFALQAPIGYFFDRFPAKRSTSIGICFILCGYILGLWQHPIVGLVLCGFGNAFYHVGGSIGIARIDRKGLRNSGIFVSAGALGVSLGTYLAGACSGLHLFSGNLSGQPALWILLLLIVLLILQQQVATPDKQKPSLLPAKINAALLLLSLAAVFIRSFGGLFFPAAYKNVFSFTQSLFPEYLMPYAFLLAMASGIVAFLGKFLGGFLSNFCNSLLHRFLRFKTLDLRSGNYIFGIITLVLSAILLLFGGNVPILCFLGILCFHAAMPVTLFELYCILPDRPGFAMGLSTVMLFLGYLPYEFFPLDNLPKATILCVLTLLAAGCMIASLLIYHRACKADRKGGSA